MIFKGVNMYSYDQKNYLAAKKDVIRSYLFLGLNYEDKVFYDNAKKENDKGKLNIFIKKLESRYKLLALKFHPDKNEESKKNQIFLNIQKSKELILFGNLTYDDFKNSELKDNSKIDEYFYESKKIEGNFICTDFINKNSIEISKDDFIKEKDQFYYDCRRSTGAAFNIKKINIIECEILKNKKTFFTSVKEFLYSIIDSIKNIIKKFIKKFESKNNFNEINDAELSFLTKIFNDKNISINLNKEKKEIVFHRKELWNEFEKNVMNKIFKIKKFKISYDDIFYNNTNENFKNKILLKNFLIEIGVISSNQSELLDINQEEINWQKVSNRFLFDTLNRLSFRSIE
jgi:hypothetical protein